MGHILIQTNLMCTLVNIHQPKNVSLLERVKICPFPFSFVDNPEEETAKNPGIQYRKRDNTVKQKMNDDCLYMHKHTNCNKVFFFSSSN